MRVKPKLLSELIAQWLRELHYIWFSVLDECACLAGIGAPSARSFSYRAISKTEFQGLDMVGPKGTFGAVLARPLRTECATQ